MSTLKVDAIRHNSATSDAITTAADGTCTAQISSLNDSYIGGRRNMIINGDHRISQRGSAAVTVTASAGYRCVDRFKSDIDDGGSPAGTFSHAQSTDVPAGQGFTHSSKITTVTQASKPGGTSNRHQIYTMLEKQDVAHLEWGTSAAKTCTLSFWVKSSVTGTYILWFRHYGGTTHSYYTNYTINSANTWEKKTITLTGYTSGGNVTGTLNLQGILIEWNLGTSSGNETGTLNEWTTSGTIRAATGSVYLPENAGATWYLTGCQFEVGSVMTPFEHRSFQEELLRCMRYYQQITGDDRGYNGATGGSGSFKNSVIGIYNGETDVRAVYYHMVPMRDEPTLTVLGALSDFDLEPFDRAPSSITMNRAGVYQSTLIIQDSGSATAGDACLVTIDQAAGGLAFSAEL